jgi:hypothetical protein
LPLAACRLHASQELLGLLGSLGSPGWLLGWPGLPLSGAVVPERLVLVLVLAPVLVPVLVLELELDAAAGGRLRLISVCTMSNQKTTILLMRAYIVEPNASRRSAPVSNWNSCSAVKSKKYLRRRGGCASGRGGA